MEIKFKKSLSEYDHLIMFDLASKITGVCVFDLKKKKPLFTKVLKVTGIIELPSAELDFLIDNFFLDLREKELLTNALVSFEAAPTQLRGGNSTVQTFIALAKAHAVLDLYLYKHKIDVYDYVGVYPISTHAYYKKITNSPQDTKVTKENLRDWVYLQYNINNLTLDESDAIFLAVTLINSKYEKDIDEQIRECKRHKKTLKAAYAIQLVDEEIARLQKLK